MVVSSNKPVIKNVIKYFSLYSSKCMHVMADNHKVSVPPTLLFRWNDTPLAAWGYLDSANHCICKFISIIKILRYLTFYNTYQTRVYRGIDVVFYVIYMSCFHTQTHRSPILRKGITHTFECMWLKIWKVTILCFC